MYITRCGMARLAKCRDKQHLGQMGDSAEVQQLQAAWARGVEKGVCVRPGHAPARLSCENFGFE